MYILAETIFSSHLDWKYSQDWKKERMWILSCPSLFRPLKNFTKLPIWKGRDRAEAVGHEVISHEISTYYYTPFTLREALYKHDLAQPSWRPNKAGVSLVPVLQQENSDEEIQLKGAVVC